MNLTYRPERAPRLLDVCVPKVERAVCPDALLCAMDVEPMNFPVNGLVNRPSVKIDMKIDPPERVKIDMEIDPPGREGAVSPFLRCVSYVANEHERERNASNKTTSILAAEMLQHMGK
jgi:hypothetical protein